MFKNYFKTAFRNLARNKAFSIINLLGLSIGLACCILIILYTKDETSFDRFQTQKDRLYQLTCQISRKDGTSDKYGMGAMVQGPAFKKEIPGIEEYVRVNNYWEVVVKKGNETFNEKITWADENFFTLFSFPLVSGNPKTVLSSMNGIVLTEEMAKKYFGTTRAIGRTMELEINKKFELFVVSGIAKPSPQNSSITFHMVLPYKYYEKVNPEDGWLWLSYSTYFLLNPQANIRTIEAKMAQVYLARAGTQIEEAKKHGGMEDKFTWGLRPFLNMHLDTSYRSDSSLGASNPIYSYILSGIALFILLIACINFVNLTVAQSLKRAKEIGVRKVVGGRRPQLIGQFLTESFIVCFIAFALALLLAKIALPLFNELANKRLALGYLFDAKLVTGMIGLFLLTGLAAGAYPALVLSGFNPVETLYNRTRLAGRNYLAKGLVVVQFALATFLIVATLFIYGQFNYLTHKDLGYNDRNLLVLTVGEGDHDHHQRSHLFQSEFSKDPGITSVAPRMQGVWYTNTRAGGKEFDVRYEHADESYLPTLQVPIVEGRNFSKDFPADSTNSVLVNQAYVAAAGWKGSAIGKTVDFLNGRNTNLTIVGVLQDYHYESLKEKIKPQLFTIDEKLPLGSFLIRLNPDHIPQTLRGIEKTYRTLVPYHPFRYDFMQDLNFKNYEAEAKWKQIITLSAILTIFISCIGLFGLTMLSAEKRFKEIGIRKVLGASSGSIVQLLSGNFIKLVLLANVIAFPIAWWAINTWLHNFAYRISLNWWVFALAGSIAVIIALLTVGAQALRAATANPVHSLRTE
jgi:putative ABC transport system permease protein